MRSLHLAAVLICLMAAAQVADDPLAKSGIHVTKGAAPGYVADKACSGCHRAVAESFQHVGMARSFYRPGADNAIETFGGIGRASCRERVSNCV